MRVVDCNKIKFDIEICKFFFVKILVVYEQGRGVSVKLRCVLKNLVLYLV